MGKGAIGVMEFCGRTLLSIINLIFLLMGMAFFGVGIFLRVGAETIMSHVDELMEQVPDIAGGVDMAGVTVPTYLRDGGDSPFNVAEIFSGLSTALIVAGVFMICVGFLGCCGACCKQRHMLTAYAVIVSVMLLVKMILVFLVVSHKFDDRLKTKFKSLIKERYVGIDDTGIVSVVWNFIMIQLECCGVDGYKDFYAADKWQRHRNFEVSVGGMSTISNLTMDAPVACCRMEGTFPSVEPIDGNCTMDLDPSISNYNSGCWNEIQKLITANAKRFAAFFAVVFFTELACIIIAVCVILREKKTTY